MIPQVPVTSGTSGEVRSQRDSSPPAGSAPRLQALCSIAARAVHRIAAKVAQIARHALKQGLAWMQWRRSEAPITTFHDLPSNALIIIGGKLGCADLHHFRQTNRACRTAYIESKLAQIRGLLAFVDQLIQAMPEPAVSALDLSESASLANRRSLASAETFTHAQINAHYGDCLELLRRCALYWAYDHPELLEGILLRCGFLPSSDPRSRELFTTVEVHWPKGRGDFLHHLFSYAILAGNLRSLQLLQRFVPNHIASASNLSSLKSNMKKNQIKMLLPILYLFSRPKWIAWEHARFWQTYGATAAQRLQAHSPALNTSISESRFTPEVEQDIWKLMKWDESPEATRDGTARVTAQLEEQALAVLESDQGNYRLTRSYHLSTRGLDLLSIAFWNRLIWSANHDVLRSQGELGRIAEALHLARAIPMKLQDSANGGESQLYNIGTSPGEWQLHHSLLEALRFSLFNSTEELDALRAAIKRYFLLTSNGTSAKFPLGKMSDLFDPLAKVRRAEKGARFHFLCLQREFSVEFLAYQWLMIAVIAQLFQVSICAITNLDRGRGCISSEEDDSKLLNLVCDKVRTFLSSGLGIDYQSQTDISTGVLVIRANFSAQSPDAIPHYILTYHSAKSPERYFTPQHRKIPESPRLGV